MVLFNYSTRELTAKIVYYGPGLCGKTTNLQYVYDSLPDNVKKGKMLSLATKTDRTLFFDFLPIELGMIRGMKTRIQLYTVPGQVFYNSTRKLVLKGADGVVFVADSQSKMLEANGESYKNLEDNLREMGIRIEEIPLVMQFNKRDLPNLSSIEEMNAQINRHNAPFYEAVATTGIGVEDTLKAITKLVLNNLASKYKLEGAPVAAPEPGTPRAAAPVPSKPPAMPARAAAAPARRSAPPTVIEETPEDLALDGLVIDPGSGPPAPTVASPNALPLASMAPGEDLLDLEEEIDLAVQETPQDGTIDLGEDLLQELEEEPMQVEAAPGRSRPAAARPSPPARQPPLRSVPPPPEPIEEEALLDLDAPIDLEPAGWEGGGEAAGEPIDIGPLAPGEERVIEVPVTATINGRSTRLVLRITVRLGR
jgi:mutual gliding-motility protein MglA